MRSFFYASGGILMLLGIVVFAPAAYNWAMLLFSGGAFDDRGFSSEVAPTFIQAGIGAALLGIGRFLWMTALQLRSRAPSGSTYVFHGPVGVAGHRVNARGARIYQQQSVDLQRLAGELASLRAALARSARSLEERDALLAVTMAEQSAHDGDGPSTETHLRAAGRTALDVARDIGVPLAVAALKRSLGLP